MIKTAVILAAGLGSRLEDKTKLKPKGFLEIEGMSLIQRSVDTLLSFGIEKIYIGTGYLNEIYDEFAENYTNIKTIKSPKFATTSSMYTLYNMRDELKEDFLLLESDLLYERLSIKYLLEHPQKDVILASGRTNSNDEVYIQTDEQHYLVEMSKNKNALTSVYAELVGISKVSKERYKQMCDAFVQQTNEKIDYEYIMVQTAKTDPFYVEKIDELVWCEIDDKTHLDRAIQKILPKIKQKENTEKN